MNDIPKYCNYITYSGLILVLTPTQLSDVRSSVHKRAVSSCSEKGVYELRTYSIVPGKVGTGRYGKLGIDFRTSSSVNE